MRLGLRYRILLAALAPALLVAVAITALLVGEQTRQSHNDQHRRLAAIARQLTVLAAYELFVDNRENLQKLVETATAIDSDVVGAAILDSRGRLIVSTLPNELLPHPDRIRNDFEPPLFSEPSEHWHGQRIYSQRGHAPDLFETGGEAPPLGHLLLKVTNAGMRDEMQRLALKAAILSGGILLFALLLAWLLSRHLIRTLAEIGQVVAGVGAGRHELRVARPDNDELGRLALGINRMAESVGQTQEALSQRIAEATARLRQERDAAEQAARSRSRFFAAASHDLRQPVQALALFAAQLEHDAGDNPLRAGIHRMTRSVRNLQALLDTLLDYSRLDGQVFQVEKRPVGTLELIGPLVEDFASAAAEKGLSLRMRLADCLLLTDAALLRRIVINLLGNAVRYTRSGGILVACRRRANHACIEVWDTGQGIPPEQQEAVFDELVQLDNPERDAEKGLGLGLAIVRRTASLLDHPLTLCSRVGHGTRFSLRVPLAPDADVRVGGILKPKTRPGAILVVGSLAHCRAIVQLLADWGLAGNIAKDIEDAQTWLREHGAPHFLILDTDGGATGIEQATELLAGLEALAGRPLPAVLIGSGPVPANCIPTGGAARLLLARPYLPARLRALVMYLLAPSED